jgi:isopenicillin-N epimerase
VRDGFLLDPDVVYLNHGGYGACSVTVFEEYQRWQRELERQPTDFFARRLSTWFWEGQSGSSLLDGARASLAAFVGAQASDIVFVPNATYGLNAVLRSLRIRPEEEILTTKHEYGAIVRTLSFIRANLVHCEPDELVANIGVRTRAVLVSHITSPTALVLPVEEICAAARKAGVLSIVDGAHAPGQIPLDLDALGADIYAGTATSGSVLPRAPGSCGRDRSTRSGSSRSSSAGATTRRRTSASATAGRERTTRPRTSQSPGRSRCTRRSTSTRPRLSPTRRSAGSPRSG